MEVALLNWLRLNEVKDLKMTEDVRTERMKQIGEGRLRANDEMMKWMRQGELKREQTLTKSNI